MGKIFFAASQIDKLNGLKKSAIRGIAKLTTAAFIITQQFPYAPAAWAADAATQTPTGWVATVAVNTDQPADNNTGDSAEASTSEGFAQSQTDTDGSSNTTAFLSDSPLSPADSEDTETAAATVGGETGESEGVGSATPPTADDGLATDNSLSKPTGEVDVTRQSTTTGDSTANTTEEGASVYPSLPDSLLQSIALHEYLDGVSALMHELLEDGGIQFELSLLTSEQHTIIEVCAKGILAAIEAEDRDLQQIYDLVRELDGIVYEYTDQFTNGFAQPGHSHLAVWWYRLTQINSTRPVLTQQQDWMDSDWDRLITNVLGPLNTNEMPYNSYSGDFWDLALSTLNLEGHYNCDVAAVLAHAILQRMGVPAYRLTVTWIGARRDISHALIVIRGEQFLNAYRYYFVEPQSGRRVYSTIAYGDPPEFSRYDIEQYLELQWGADLKEGDDITWAVSPTPTLAMGNANEVDINYLQWRVLQNVENRGDEELLRFYTDLLQNLHVNIYAETAHYAQGQDVFVSATPSQLFPQNNSILSANPEDLSVTAEGLPPGLVLLQDGPNWYIQGRPTASGTFETTVTVTVRNPSTGAQISFSARVLFLIRP